MKFLLQVKNILHPKDVADGFSLDLWDCYAVCADKENRLTAQISGYVILVEINGVYENLLLD